MFSLFSSSNNGLNVKFYLIYYATYMGQCKKTNFTENSSTVHIKDMKQIEAINMTGMRGPFRNRTRCMPEKLIQLFDCS